MQVKGAVQAERGRAPWAIPQILLYTINPKSGLSAKISQTGNTLRVPAGGDRNRSRDGHSSTKSRYEPSDVRGGENVQWMACGVWLRGMFLPLATHIRS